MLLNFRTEVVQLVFCATTDLCGQRLRCNGHGWGWGGAAPQAARWSNPHRWWDNARARLPTVLPYYCRRKHEMSVWGRESKGWVDFGGRDVRNDDLESKRRINARSSCKHQTKCTRSYTYMWTMAEPEIINTLDSSKARLTGYWFFKINTSWFKRIIEVNLGFKPKLP